MRWGTPHTQNTPQSPVRSKPPSLPNFSKSVKILEAQSGRLGDMYSDLPSLMKWANRLALAGAWSAGSYAGIAALTYSPVTISEAQPDWWLPTWATLMLAGCLGALFAVVSGRNRVEEVSSWVASAGAFAYVSTVWSLVLDGAVTRSTQASFITMAFFFILSRALTAWAHNYRVRKVATSAINLSEGRS